MIESLEHFKYPDDVMFKVSKMLKSAGRLFITTPMKSEDDNMLHPAHKIEYSETTLSCLMESYFYSHKFVLPEQYGITPYKGRNFLLCVATWPKFKEEKLPICTL